MDNAAIISVDIEKGSEIVSILEQAKIKIIVAAWMHLAEYGDWRLVISARQFDLPDPRHAYRLLDELLATAGFARRMTPTVFILPTTDPFIRAIRRAYGKTGQVEGLRLSGQLLADRFVEDSYLYRIA
jgi:hypothetical protein